MSRPTTSNRAASKNNQDDVGPPGEGRRRRGGAGLRLGRGKRELLPDEDEARETRGSARTRGSLPSRRPRAPSFPSVSPFYRASSPPTRTPTAPSSLRTTRRAGREALAMAVKCIVPALRPGGIARRNRLPAGWRNRAPFRVKLPDEGGGEPGSRAIREREKISVAGSSPRVRGTAGSPAWKTMILSPAASFSAGKSSRKSDFRPTCDLADRRAVESSPGGARDETAPSGRGSDAVPTRRRGARAGVVETQLRNARDGARPRPVPHPALEENGSGSEARGFERIFHPEGLVEDAPGQDVRFPAATESEQNQAEAEDGNPGGPARPPAAADRAAPDRHTRSRLKRTRENFSGRWES